MKPSIIALALLCSPLLASADDCTFDQEHQRTVVAAVAQFEPGAAVDFEKRQVSWTTQRQEVTVFGYGGCADLGSTVTRLTPTAAPRTQSQVFAVAKELAERFWSNDKVAAHPATETLLAALSSSQFTVARQADTSSFEVQDPGYVQLFVAHEYANGIDRVTITWQGNF